MPLKYNPDTGIPYFVADDAIELEEGVTPKPDVITSKSAMFAGDGDRKGTISKPKGYGTEGPIPLGKLLGQEGPEPTVQPADLRRRYASDEEVEEIWQLATTHKVFHWPALIGLINRLRKAEGRAME